MAGKIEEVRTVAVSLAAVTHTKVKKRSLQVTPEADKTDRPEATHSLIVAVGHVIAEKQLTRETVNHPTKTPLQDLRQVKIQDLRQVQSQRVPQIKSPRLGRQAKRAPMPKLTRRSRLPLVGFAYVGRDSRYVLSEVHSDEL